MKERNSDNESVTEELPSVLPIEVIKMRPRDFNELVKKHKERLLTKYNERYIGELEDEFKKFKRYALEDATGMQSIDNVDEASEFEVCWKPFDGRFTRVYEFLGGLATVFPTTATVEADFSALKWTKDEYSQSLSDFSLEAKLHAAQYKDIIKIHSKLKRMVVQTGPGWESPRRGGGRRDDDDDDDSS